MNVKMDVKRDVRNNTAQILLYLFVIAGLTLILTEIKFTLGVSDELYLSSALYFGFVFDKIGRRWQEMANFYDAKNSGCG